MFSTGTVAGFAALLRGTGFLIKCGLPVGRFLPAVVNLFMTRLAGFRADVLGGIGRWTGGRMHRWRWGTLATLRGSLARHEGDQQQQNQDREQESIRRGI